MSWTPENSAIRMTAELEKKISTASMEEIKDILAQAALDQQLVTRDSINPEVLLPTALAGAAPKRFGKVVVLNGIKHILEAEDELGLQKAENDLYRRLVAPAAEMQQSDQPRDAAGRFTSQPEQTPEDAVAKAELELKFKRGEISTDDYLSQSGAIERHLETQGISLQDLKTATETAYQTNWESATESFLARHPEWVGGEDAVRVVGEMVFSLGLQDQPSVETLEAVYAELQRTNRVPTNPALEAAQEAHDRISQATNFEEIRSTGHHFLFGR